ncbi:HEAT repeat domain-containing protein [Methanoplanus sp. FWC-SCC4]|uniref:HEAT repeat domain-containing protein n=1 Tax=Methanochimaera problematica TaxID=2609417 RepID=A0AA97FGH4_9EURY|nr:HEAT repeat domain-containing protein [Methanoplanus sp. FWC-SCC4]WOF17001.1 HEAT repeat domain-containing protein [Methanoplanus sp. FWC-SCC4]
MKEIKEMIEKRDISGLIEILMDKDIYKSTCAMDSLCSFESEAVIPLAEKLESEDINQRWKAAMVLANIGKPAVETLLNAVENNSSGKRPATWALGEIGDTKTVPHLIKVLKEDKNEFDRVMAASALLRIGHEDGVREVTVARKKEGPDFNNALGEASRSQII